MKKLKINFLVIMILSVVLVLSGCFTLSNEPGETSSNNQTDNDGTTINHDDPNATTTASQINSEPDNTADDNLMADVIPAAWDGDLKPVEPQIAEHVMRYAGSLLLHSIDNDINVMVSPASVFLALAMTLNGADGPTRNEMAAVLTDASLTDETINEFSRIWINNLVATGGDKTTISIANSIWFREGFDADPDFLQVNADYYGAGARALDFSDEQTKDIINAWVNDNTNGLIKQIISQINPSTVMYLINTVYFKSVWETPFEKIETFNRSFMTSEGEISHAFMHRFGDISYFAFEDAEGIVLPYDNGRFAYVAVLPDQTSDPRTWLKEQTAEHLFADLFERASEAKVNSIFIGLPKYKAAYEDALNNELSDMGMPTAFDGGAADFSRLNQGRRQGLYISEVKHKTFIEVDEKGTEAAAATSVAVDESMPYYEKELFFDRPFFYAIIDMENGLPLFSGILDNPAD